MSSFSDPSGEKLLEPLHPSLKGKKYTVEDCYVIAMSIGVSPDIVAGTLTGRVLPNIYIRDALSKVIGKELVDAVCDDYHPDRFYSFFEEEHSLSDYSIKNKYPISSIKPGDHIRCVDGRWIVVSDMKKHERTCVVYSNGVYCFSTGRDSYVVTAVTKSPKRDFKSMTVDGRMTTRAAKEIMKESSSEEQEKRMSLFESILNNARSNS